MHCPFCGHSDTRVIDSRYVAATNQVRRRRQCLACFERFTTYETAALSLPRVIKRDGLRETFSEEKLRGGMMRALEKRPVETARVEAAIGRIIKTLIQSGEKEIEAQRLGELVMNALRELDEVAYIRFASVYLSFDNINAFREVIERLEREPSPALRDKQIPLLKGDVS
ncbi:MAG TPA: transcriptional repressor NrdR [Halothiobacillus sp.]|nr:transcriptional repressor NrdR [Halothiobacillus sp.]